MLLTEILDKPTNQIRTSDKPVNDIIQHRNTNVIGTGAQAIAYMHKKFPGKVVKTIQITGTDDPSYQFLRLAMRHQNNPYFPKIFSVKMYPTNKVEYNTRGDEFDKIDPLDKNGFGKFSPPPSQLGYTIYVAMEKLTKHPNLTTNDLEYFGIQDFPIPQRMRGYKRQSEIKFRLAFKDADYRQYMQQIVKDPQLKQALRLLEPLFRHYEPDMHGSNIMMRGNQMVIIDPISNDSY